MATALMQQQTMAAPAKPPAMPKPPAPPQTNAPSNPAVRTMAVQSGTTPAVATASSAQLKPMPAPAPAPTGAAGSSVQDYMNPYLESALQPTIRKINEQGELQRSQIGSQAAMSGAFGDARHGVIEAQQMRDQNQLVADTTAQQMAAGFNAGAGLRENDVNRQFTAGESAANRDLTWQTLLQQLEQQNKDRQLNATQVGSQIDLATKGQQMQWLDQLMGIDNYNRGWNQQELNTQFEDWMRKQGYDMDQLGGIAGILSGMPRQQTTTTSSPNNTFSNLAGSILGGLF